VLKLRSPATVLLLAALTALGPLATDMYLPALPAIARGLNAGADQVQLTLSLYMAGFAISQLLCGPLSDHYGRKPILLAGFSIFTAASVLCALAPNIETLLLGRFLQSFGGAVGPVLGRAAVRDIYQPLEAGRILAYMATAMALAPIGGGLLLLFYGWDSIFLVLAAWGVMVIALLALALPEPLPATRRQPIRPGVILSNFRMLLGERRFIGYSLSNACAFAGLFAFLSGSSFVLIEFLGIPPTSYGFYFAVGVAGFMVGSLIGGHFSRRCGIDRLILAGAALTTLGGSLMAALAWAELYSVAAIVLPHAVFMAGVGILMPLTMAGALADFPQCAGAASSLFGFIQMTSAATVGALVGQLHDGTSRTMALAIGLAGTGALLSYLMLVRSGEAAIAAGRLSVKE
jgi:DHA1 family bicyclomycin/chloramphenicol resistance-like MFS transporter